MLMIGEGNRSNRTVHISPWCHFDNSTAQMIFPLPVSCVSVRERKSEYSPSLLTEVLTALHRYDQTDTNSDFSGYDSYVSPVTYSCDEFRMYDFKVRRCTRDGPHEWVECPYAHPGEKASRRDPLKFNYGATGCTDFRKGYCKKGDSCEYAHGVFESWLHPDRYRTQPCKDGTDCRRRVCFFAHTAEQLRVVTQQSPRTRPTPPLKTESPRSSYDGSPIRHGLDSYFMKGLSPTSNLMSSSPPPSPPSGFCSPIGGLTRRSVFNNLPSTPTRSGCLDFWDIGFEEDRAMNKVESGREVRVKLFTKLSEQNSFERVDSFTPVPDVGWV
ncbi:zinc finger protein [Macleaya cordata]|uniref:Zinc finger protein n=1 Tax=Macleaya cordata TaxID=56857 RepID=A0A200QDD2_MACCD|nr:zinc finger protein [Macleaya cordata]